MSKSLAASRARSRAKAREATQAIAWIVAALALTVAALGLAAVVAGYMGGRTVNRGMAVTTAVFLVIGLVAMARGAGGGQRRE